MSVTGPGSPLPVHKALGFLTAIGAVAVVLGILVAGLAIPFAGVLGISAKNLSESLDDLPAELETESLSQKSRILDADGRLLAMLWAPEGNRVSVPLSEISRSMVQAIVSIEDYRFYQHGALDLKGTLRALITNQASGGEVVQGGSSITQQLVKLTLLTQADSAEEARAATDDTYERKVRELRYAIALEEKRSKDWILERYLNIAYFGDGAYGIQTAARHYFDKNAAALNVRESAVLAGMVKNPSNNPVDYPDRALERRNLVLSEMAELNVISPTRAAALSRQDLGLNVNPDALGNGCLSSRAPFFCDYVYNYLLQDQRLGDTVEARRELLLTGGLTIHTTVDMSFQRPADRAVRDAVFPTDQAIGALAEVVPGTGEVRALAQSRPMGRNKRKGQTFLNYVVPREYGDANGFQAGSTFKAFTLAAAINQGVPLNYRIPAPSDIVLDEATFRDCGGEPYGTADWSVGGGGGVESLYTGTSGSVNTFYAQLIRITGLCEPFRLARKMGVRLTQPLPNEDGLGAERTPSFTLGTADVSPLEMAEAYATFAARGLHCDARPVTSIEGAGGSIVRDYPAQCQQVLPTDTADAVNDVLQGVLAPGGTADDIPLGIPAAGKTGTRNENKAVWFVGYTPKLAAAATVAGANQAGTQLTLNGTSVGGQTIFGEAFGGTVAGPIWRQAMLAVLDRIDGEDFVEPDAVTIAGVVTEVPDVTGQSLDSAQAELRAAGFASIAGSSVNSRLAEGLVVATSPGALSDVPSGELITITLSTGVAPRPPPRPNGGPGNNGPGNNGPGNGGPAAPAAPGNSGPGGGNGRGGDDD